MNALIDWVQDDPARSVCLFLALIVALVIVGQLVLFELSDRRDVRAQEHEADIAQAVALTQEPSYVERLTVRPGTPVPEQRVTNGEDLLAGWGGGDR